MEMTPISHAIFRAVHEGKWLSVEYKNQTGGLTKYWLAVKSINPQSKKLKVDGLHLGCHTVAELDIYITRIKTAHILYGTYYPINTQLVEDIKINPHQYTELFGNVPNLRILNYLSDCNRLDSIPHRYEHALIPKLDTDRFRYGDYTLDNEQFSAIIASFQAKTKHEYKQFGQLALNVISVETKSGLYVLAYREIMLDVKKRRLIAAEHITLCREFTVNGEKQSVSLFLSEEYLSLLDNIHKNLEEIKDAIAKPYQHSLVNDLPYMLAVEREYVIDLEREYSKITEQYHNGEITVPLKAFFGELTKRPQRRKDYPLALSSRQINLDQLLSINKAMKYPLAYIQGPPGTGKTYTIVNTILTALFNRRSVLFSSYNNHPIDGVVNALRNLQCNLPYNDKSRLLPIIRLGNIAKVNNAIDAIGKHYNAAKEFDTKELSVKLDAMYGKHSEHAQQLNELLKRYEEILDLQERSETIEHLLKDKTNLHFQAVLLQQQDDINKKLTQLGNVSIDDAIPLLPNNTEQILAYLYCTAMENVKRLSEPKYVSLLKIINEPKSDKRVKEFNLWLSIDENFRSFLRIFPVIITTCLSSYRLGEPKPYFDMVIMDEASQCNTAVSLVPIIRGETLTLVGDTQQLSPVILLDKHDNRLLRKRYAVPEDYDYINNSIYKTFLACDAVSDEILLSHHYRCNSRIIGFNNQKYYNNKLRLMKKDSLSDIPLLFVNIENAPSPPQKNTAPEETETIIDFVKQHKKEHPNQSIGIITPFVNQKEHINEMLHHYGITDVLCGTVHAFQGDEKEVILFSTALTDATHQKTYDWVKNNKELVNVAVSRAKEQFVAFVSADNLERLHDGSTDDDLYELTSYVRSNGVSKVTKKVSASRALGIKPYSTETEEAFLETLRHAIDNLPQKTGRYEVEREVNISHIFQDDKPVNDLFYTGRFDFVIYEVKGRGDKTPVLAVELDGREHVESEIVKERDRKKAELCRQHGFSLLRVENSYARRYVHIKEVLLDYFKKK
ncbi:MAG: DUF2726 domain-containing protein [Planctomycetaceae bacterium]|nr:DUF2726 domain-containing protein [Planctomycetaceae bacterium]